MKAPFLFFSFHYISFHFISFRVVKMRYISQIAQNPDNCSLAIVRQRRFDYFRFVYWPPYIHSITCGVCTVVRKVKFENEFHEQKSHNTQKRFLLLLCCFSRFSAKRKPRRLQFCGWNGKRRPNGDIREKFPNRRNSEMQRKKWKNRRNEEKERKVVNYKWVIQQVYASRNASAASNSYSSV